MKKYKVVVTPEAKRQMQAYLYYLKYVLKNEQAAIAVRDDYMVTVQKLRIIADSLRLCENPNLVKRKIRKIVFQKHNYVMLYRLDDRTVIILKIYHGLQDYENIMH